MTLTWGTWKPDPTADPAQPDDFASPYVDWYEQTELSDRDGVPSGIRIVPHAPLSMVLSAPGMPAVASGAPPASDDESSKIPAIDFISLAFPRVPLPDFALLDDKIKDPEPRKGVLDRIDPPAPDSVIVGVIDAGIALAHERFRRKGAAGTRILSAWQQGGRWTNTQPHLPFGHELMQKDIDDLMAACATGGRVDEQQFNRAAGISDFGHPRGDRAPELAATHGTHVLDLAAGCAPDEGDRARARVRDRQPIIAVTLPPRSSIGPSGSFLELFAIWAIRHIVTTADAIWRAMAKDPAFVKTKRSGYPIVINMSYGLQAGPKDGQMLIQKYIDALNDWRKDNGWSPLRIVLPAGNDNLERGVAVLELPNGGAEKTLAWRIRPEDRTSSYAEVWTDVAAGKPKKKPKHPFTIALTTPGGVSGPGSQGEAGQICDLTHQAADGTETVVARLYCRLADNAQPGFTATHHRLCYVLCVAPTWRKLRPEPPAGRWTVTLAAPGGRATALLYVQSDQDPTPGAATGLLSYFDDRGFGTHDPTGRPIDTFAVDPLTGAVTFTDSTGPVRRQNSLNAVAGVGKTVTVAGYRATDGRPAPYSSSGRGFGRDVGRPWPDLACVSDDSPACFGRLAAGSGSGSVAAMQGTSFATAEATRVVARKLMDWLDAGADPATAPMTTAGCAAVAAAADPALGFGFAAAAMKLKLGSGRLPREDHGRVARRG